MSNLRKPGHVALDRAISKLGLASRSVSRKLIQEGKVKVNGLVVKNPEHQVIPEKIKIEIDGVAQKNQKKITIILNKPKGLITTHSDEQGRPTVYSCLTDLANYHLSPVGRLDQATTGLLIFTNDTRLSSWLTDPKSRVSRIYIVTVRGEVTEETTKKLTTGLKDGEDLLTANHVEILKTSGKESLIKIELLEGKNREIRRMMLTAGHEVTKLKRISFGNLMLGELESGKWRELTPLELKNAFPDFF